MKFQPTEEEKRAGISLLANEPSDLNAPELAVSGSLWDEEHLVALRVVLLDELPIHRIFPDEFMSSDNVGEVYIPLLPLK
jgi:hypothetical protein